MRGLRLASVGKGDPARALRPTSDRVRESLFSTLEHGPAGDPVPGAAVLDVFAGTGALGLEALSRGAETATFIEDGRAALALLSENIAKSKTGSRARLLRRNALKPGPAGPEAATLIFLDPPYGKALGDKALAALEQGGWIAPGAVIVWEEHAPQTPPEGFTLIEHRAYGQTALTLLRFAP